MKPFLVFAFVACVLPLWARILTVSNMPNSPGQYTDPEIAEFFAFPNDTMYIHGSNLNYGMFVITHDDLVIIGSGHNPDKQFPRVTSFTNIQIVGNNVQLIGITANNIVLFQPHFTMRRCKILGPGPGTPALVDNNNFNNIKNFLFESNVFTGDETNIRVTATDDDIIVLRNNVFSYIVDIAAFSPPSVLLVTNNIFLKGPFAFGNINFATISNNIFYGPSPFVSISSTITYTNNISFQCANNIFTTGPNITLSNNLEDVDPLFANYPGVGAVFSNFHDYNLMPGSPAIATGSDGTDRGVYGGFGTIFNMRGAPPIAEIGAVNITSPTTVAQGGTLNVTITSRRVH